MDITTYPAATTYPGATTWPGFTVIPDPPATPPTRHSSHTARAWTVETDGTVTELGDVDVTLNFDESLAPYGDATVEAVLTEATYPATDPLLHRGLRLHLELVESIGDPIRIWEITADHGGSVAAITAAYAPVSPADLTAAYFTSWNLPGTRPGAALRANLLVTGRDVDYATNRMSFTAATDEALLTAYKLVSTVPETSGSASVRDTVNYALAKVGAILTPYFLDAIVDEPDAIIWEPGTSGWDYARNVAEAKGFALRCDEHRRWTLTPRDMKIYKPGGPDPDDPGVDLGGFTGATERITLDDDTWADAAVVVYTWTDPNTDAAKVRYDVASQTANPIKVVRVDRATPYPGPGAAKYWLNRSKGRGRVFDLEEVGDYLIRPGMAFNAVLPYGAYYGYIESVSWNAPSDRGTIRTRQATDADIPPDDEGA